MHIIDAFHGIERVYYNTDSCKARLAGWRLFMKQFPEIRDACIDDYTAVGIDWQNVACERVFNVPKKTIVSMLKTHKRLTKLCLETDSFLKGFKPNLTEGVTLVLYHGLDNGAGWARTYANQPAIWLGIEKIVALNWQSKAALTALIAHEYAHIWHALMRQQSIENFNDACEDPIFRLYVEGLAMVCETNVQPYANRSKQWERACLKKIDSLKNQYSQSIRNHDDAWRNFYGDWHRVEDLVDTGYFLGMHFVKEQLKKMSLYEVAIMTKQDLKRTVHTFLQPR